MNFNSFKVMKSKYVQFSGSFSNTNDAIATASTIDAFGKSVNQYVNVDGNYNYGADFYYDFELYKGINFGMNTGVNGGRYNNIVNGVKNTNDNISTRLGIQLSYWAIKKLTFGVVSMHPTIKPYLVLGKVHLLISGRIVTIQMFNLSLKRPSFLLT